MNSLSLIECIYSGTPYKESERMLVDPSEVNLSFKFKASRFDTRSKTRPIEVVPYKIDFEKYCAILSRVTVVTDIYVGSGALNLYSKAEEFAPFLLGYDSVCAVVREPLNMQNLLYPTGELSPLGILALLFRKCYGDQAFKRYINSTLLKEFRKVKLKNGPAIYLRSEYPLILDSIVNLHDSGLEWEHISDFMVRSPYAFMWRD